MRSVLPLALVLLIALPGVGCRRNKGPSPAYIEAKTAYDRLVTDKSDEAYADPAMTDVEAKLRTVPGESSDAPAASALLATIQSERARIAEEKAAEASAAETPTGGGFEDREETGEPTDEGDPNAAKDAGVELPTVGMSLGDFLTKFSRCFEAGPEVMVSGLGMRQTFQLKDLGNCRDLYPDFTRYVLLVADGKIVAFGNRSAMELRLPDGGLPPEQGTQQGSAAQQQQQQQQQATQQPATPTNDPNVTRPEPTPSTEGTKAEDYNSIKY